MSFNLDRIKEFKDETPFFVFSKSILKQKFLEYKEAFPKNTEICYAMKANSEIDALMVLIDQGSSFEVASKYELATLIELGVSPKKILYGTAVKPEKHIVDFVEYGVDRFSFDSMEELLKIARHSPSARVYVRVLVDDESNSVFKMSEKFGISTTEGVELLLKAKEMGMVPYGMSFNVGSQARNKSAWGRGLNDIATCVNTLEKMGIKLSVVNIGGGFPQQYQNDEAFPNILEIANIVKLEIAKFPYDIDLIIEPGRGLVANSFILVTTVIARSTRSSGEWLYVDAGVYNAFLEAMAWQGTTRYHLEALEKHDAANLVEYILTGPTGDNLDVVHQKAKLPSDIKAGDKIVIHDVGAYTFPLITKFNGFPKPEIIS